MMKYYYILCFYIFTVLILIACTNQVSQNKSDDRISIIIDADTANEVDDLFALVRALAEPNFNLLGITSAQFHISPFATDTTVLESQHMNEDIVKFMNREDVATPLGSNHQLESNNKAAVSKASEFIIAKAHEMKDEKLHVVILGPCTNVASAILTDSTIIPKVVVHYLGFWHDTLTNIYDKKEFNSGNDTIAVNLLLNTLGLDFNVMTATTSQHLIFDRDTTFQHLGDGGAIAKYLKNRWMTYERWWTEEDPQRLSWVMWDVAIVAALAKPDLATKRLFTTPVGNRQRQIGVYTKVDVKAMTDDFWHVYNDHLRSQQE